MTDDLTGAADSGSYFTNRGLELTIFTELEPEEMELRKGEHTAYNLSTRNASRELAFRRHFEMFRKIPCDSGHVIMKKIGTGFRGQDPYEINGILAASPEFVCFIVDSAPDLGTFTLYGNQYCEGCILTKSLYAKDPVMPPKKSSIVEILKEGVKEKIGAVDIDVVKGDRERLAAEVRDRILDGCRVIVFDVVSKEDALKLVELLDPVYPNAVWTGSLGIAQALAVYLCGDEAGHGDGQGDGKKQEEALAAGGRCACFTASAYEAAKRQVRYSEGQGLLKVELDIDRILDGESGLAEQAVCQYLDGLKTQNVILVPKVERYSYKEGTSKKILELVTRCAEEIGRKGAFDRLVVIGGETAQSILRVLQIHEIALLSSRETGAALGVIESGGFKGKTLALKGGSIGSDQALEYMMGRSREGGLKDG